MRFIKRLLLQVRAQRAGSAKAPQLQQGRTIFGGELESTGFFATVMTFGLKTAPMAGGGQAKGATRSAGSALRSGGRVVRGGGSGSGGDIDADQVRLGFKHCDQLSAFTFLVTKSRHKSGSVLGIDTCFGVCGEVNAAPCCD